MRHLALLTLLAALFAATRATAQTVAAELSACPELAASNFAAYPGPRQPRLTAPPEGMVPFYVSHYGRHGSRYMSKAKEYDQLFLTLDKAARLGKLTPLGLDVLGCVDRIRREARGRYGELTPLGEEQVRQIARRMGERFPEVFADGATVTGQSTLAIRCILSMQASLLELQRCFPGVAVSGNASILDLPVLSYDDRELQKNISAMEAREAYADFCRRHECWHRPVEQLFSDHDYLRDNVDGERTAYYLFRMASNVQNMELRGKLSLFRLFTTDEIMHNWQMNNAYWFLGYGHTPLNGGCQPFAQRHLLRRIISDADSCLRLKRPGAQLRFGHDTVLLPLVCLMGVDGYDRSIGALDSLEQLGWVDYRVFPMACNIQLVFYRSAESSEVSEHSEHSEHSEPSESSEFSELSEFSDPSVLFKVLLNENEATLPLPDDLAPYYRWTDFRRFALQKLSTFQPAE